MYTSFIDFPSLSRLDSEMSCFICGLVSYETHSIIDTRTLYRDITLDNVVYDFISKYFDIEIEDEDIVCDTCVALLEALDRLRCELEDVERMLLLQVNRKYKLGEARVCPMDDRTAQRYQKGTYERFACVECSFETDFADCLMPHSWRHDYQPDFKKRSPIETDHSIDADVCSVCDLVFSCGELLEWHFQEFHGDLVTTDVVNEDASSPDQQEIDEQGVNDDNVNNEEITDKNETKGEVITDLLLCDVSWTIFPVCSDTFSFHSFDYRNANTGQWYSRVRMSCNNIFEPFTLSVKFVIRNAEMKKRCRDTFGVSIRSTYAINVARSSAHLAVTRLIKRCMVSISNSVVRTATKDSVPNHNFTITKSATQKNVTSRATFAGKNSFISARSVYMSNCTQIHGRTNAHNAKKPSNTFPIWPCIVDRIRANCPKRVNFARNVSSVHQSLKFIWYNTRACTHIHVNNAVGASWNDISEFAMTIRMVKFPFSSKIEFYFQIGGAYAQCARRQNNAGE